ncbi:MAG: hypothetical protein AB7R89_11135 [Dehalococcoidia bacterium]
MAFTEYVERYLSDELRARPEIVQVLRSVPSEDWQHFASIVRGHFQNAGNAPGANLARPLPRSGTLTDSPALPCAQLVAQYQVWELKDGLFAAEAARRKEEATRL